jgi:hypothetical protein
MKKGLLFLLLFCSLLSAAQKTITTDVLVVGGGTGGTAAGIQSARMGVKTVIVEPTPWLGGMISAAGVSAVDGNHRLPSGLWAEFREHIYKVYGGPKAVETGWVSNTLFEPHVADSIFKLMTAAEKNLSVYHNYIFTSLVKNNNKIAAIRFKNKQTGDVLVVQAKLFIDATELGDVMKAAGVKYDVGMEAGSITGEKVGINKSNNIVQDLTYVATLKDYGTGVDKTIPKPANYNPSEFDGACTDYYIDKSRKAPTVDGKKMLEYGKLPNNKYMINWPNYGNDTYLNIIEMNEAQREKELIKAKQTTLRFVYFIQQQLGFKNLGLADDEFPTKDGLALMPYHREGRRVKGMVRFTMRHIAEPFTYGDPLYRTGISVGDYPIDHHHKKNLAAPQHLEFYAIPSFSIPLGALIPQNFDNLIIAEKGISVSNVANGTTRLQPCVLLTGQAAGALAALSSIQKLSPGRVPVRTVQQQLLKSKAYILPYIDVTPDHPHWEAVQKIGATGILRGTGIPYKWANQTWFYPDSLVDTKAFIADLNAFQKGTYNVRSNRLLISEAVAIANSLKKSKNGFEDTTTEDPNERWQRIWEEWGLANYDPERSITRLELAVLLNNTVDPFSMKAVNHKGVFTK